MSNINRLWNSFPSCKKKKEYIIILSPVLSFFILSFFIFHPFHLFHHDHIILWLPFLHSFFIELMIKQPFGLALSQTVAVYFPFGFLLFRAFVAGVRSRKQYSYYYNLQPPKIDDTQLLILKRWNHKKSMKIAVAVKNQDVKFFFWSFRKKLKKICDFEQNLNTETSVCPRIFAYNRRFFKGKFSDWSRQRKQNVKVRKSVVGILPQIPLHILKEP